MIEELDYFKNQVHRLGMVEAQALYDRGMATAISPRRYEAFFPDEHVEVAEHRRLELAVAAEGFAYAYLNQHGQLLEGAADPEKFEDKRPAPRPILSGDELRNAIIDHLRASHPNVLPLGLR